jgi:DNA repair protein RadB
MGKIPTGSAELDRLLDGGYETDVMTTIYGPAGSGKTNLCLMCVASIARDRKVLFIDADGGFSVERLKQLSPDYRRLLDNIMIFKPTSFAEQRKAVSELIKIVNPSTGLIIVDTIVTLYRVEKTSQQLYDLMRELGLQVSDLSEIARKKDIPVLLTSQVYEKGDEVKMVRGDLLGYVSKCIIALENLNGTKRLRVEKHRSIPQRTLSFRIADKGIEKLTHR